MKIGYVGLGAMGRALAARLIGQYSLCVWDLNPSAVEDFLKRGASTVPTLAELAGQCEVILLCLPRSSDVQQVLFGPGGMAERLAPGAIVIDQTSGVPERSSEFASELARKGIAMIDAPVSGGVPAALAGAITIMASGADDAYEKSLPVLRAISPKVFHCSARVGDGQATKLVNNMMNGACRMATLEIAAVGRKLGLPLGAMTAALNEDWGRSFISSRLLPAMLARTPSSDFALALMVKDVNQAIALGMQSRAPMPISNVARGLMQIALNTLGAQARLDDLVPFMESMARVRFLDDTSEAEQADTAGTTHLIVNAAAACNRLIAYENAAVGAKFGLDVAAMSTIINNGSGASLQSEQVLPSLTTHAPTTEVTLAQIVDDLAQLIRLGGDCGVPMLIVNEVHAQYEARMNQVGGSECLDAMVNHYETAAGVQFGRRG